MHIFFLMFSCSCLHLVYLLSLLWHCSGAHRPLVLQEVWISGESSSRGESHDQFSFRTTKLVPGLHHDKVRDVCKPPDMLAYRAFVYVGPVCHHVKWHKKNKQKIQCRLRRNFVIGTVTCIFVYLKYFFPKIYHLPPSSSICLFAIFRSVYYVARTVIPYQMDLIQIVKIAD